MPVKLLMRPKWQDGESWCGYLLRLAHLNVIPGFTQMATMGGMTYASLVSGQPAAALHRFGVTHPDVPQIVIPDSKWGSTDQLPKHRRPRYTTVCPDCLRSDPNPFLRALWDFPLEATCHTHKVRLLAVCPRCCAKVQIRRGQFLHCECGMPLRDWHAQKDELSTENLREVFGLTLAPVNELTFQPPSERELVAFVVLRNIAYASGLEVEKTAKNMPRLLSPVDRYNIIARSVDWFENWPRNFKERLVGSRWDPCAQGVSKFDRNSLRVLAFPQLFQVWKSLVNDRRSARLSSARERNMSPYPDRVSLREARLALELSEGVCRDWASHGVFGDIKYEQKGWYSRIWVNRKAVVDVQRLLQQTISLDEACECLETSARVVHVLIKSSLLREHRILLETSTARLWRDDVSQFSEELCSVALRTQSVTGMQSLVQALKYIYQVMGPEVVTKFVFEIFAQSVPLYRKRLARAKLTNLHIPKSELKRFYRRANNGNSISTKA